LRYYLLSVFTTRPPPDLSPLSLPDALPICGQAGRQSLVGNARSLEAIGVTSGRLSVDAGSSSATIFPVAGQVFVNDGTAVARYADRKSTRLNSSHVKISYAVFCLKKKKKQQ